MIRFCGKCGASLTAGALYCGECGALDRSKLRERAKRDATENLDLRRRGLVVGLIVAGALASLLLGALVLPESMLGAAALASSIDVATAAVALTWIGRGTWRHALGRSPQVTHLLLSLPLAAATFAVAWAWVELIHAMFEVPDEVLEAIPEPTVSFWIVALVFAPLAEEWLCRGALWAVIRPVTTRRVAIVVTALVFGFLHGLNGLFVLEIPHRFVMGLVLGWLRATTGSIWPCVLAHALHNLAALATE